MKKSIFSLAFLALFLAATIAPAAAQSPSFTNGDFSFEGGADCCDDPICCDESCCDEQHASHATAPASSVQASASKPASCEKPPASCDKPKSSCTK